MSIFSAITGFLIALPDLIKLVNQFMLWLDRVSGSDPQSLVKSFSEAFQTLNEAKTEEDRISAAKTIADTLAKL